MVKFGVSLWMQQLPPAGQAKKALVKSGDYHTLED